MEKLASHTLVRQLAQDKFDDDKGRRSHPLFVRGGGVVCCDFHPIWEDRGMILSLQTLQLHPFSGKLEKK